MANADELAPGVRRPSRESCDAADRMHAVPQIDEVRFTLDNGHPLHCSRFQYQRLEHARQIRLVCLRPGQVTMGLQDGRSAFVCEIVPFMLQNAPDFTALSYAWGNLYDVFPVLVRQGDEKRIVTVTKSLVTALLRRAFGTTTQYFWADQLCINQYDPIEKAQQVGMMRDIFGQAQNTLVWLGNARESMDRAFALVDEIEQEGAEPDNIQADWDLMTDATATERDFDVEHWQQAELYEALEELIHLPQRPWFTRLWTYQEVIVSRSVQVGCGIYNFSLRSFVLAIVIAARLLTKWTPGALNIREVYFSRRRYQDGQRLHLSDIIMGLSRLLYRCTHPLDRVYALIGLQSDQNRCQIPVDYSLSVREVHLAVTREIIRTTNSLQLLGQVRSSSFPDLPSWVPRWHAESKEWDLDYGATKYNCCSSRSHLLEVSLHPDELVVRGRTVASIKAICSHRFSDFEEEFNEHELSAAMGPSALFPNFAAPRYRAFLGLQHSARLPDEERYIREQIALTLTCSESTYHPVLAPSSLDEWDDFSDLIDHLQKEQPQSVRYCRGRRLAAIDHYALGLVPEMAKEGDLICVVHGSNIPLVFRRYGESYGDVDAKTAVRQTCEETEIELRDSEGIDGPKYHFVGVCYVKDIMNGEAVDWKVDQADRFVLV